MDANITAIMENDGGVDPEGDYVDDEGLRNGSGALVDDDVDNKQLCLLSSQWSSIL